MNRRIRSLLIAFASFAVTAVIALVRAQDKPVTAPSSVPTIAPDAPALLDQMRDAYAKLNSLELVGTFAMDVDAGGQAKKHDSSFTSSFQSPNKLQHEMKDDLAIVSTGEKLFAHLVARNAYVILDAPKSRGEALVSPVRELVREQNPSLFLAVSDDGAKDLLASATDVTKLDDVKLDAAVLSALRITYPDRDVQLLIDPATHLLKRVEVDFRKSLEKSGVPQIKRAVATIDYSKVQPDATVDAARFAWAPPEGATQLKLDAPEVTGVAGAGGGGEADYPANALKDKPAPDFKLEDATGRAVTLSALKGSVVVLDFWATWCPPCREELPALDQLATRRAGEGVKVFAVNLREDPEKVGQFVAANKLQVPVLFDFNGQVADKYLVEPIPQSVVIDKQGIVRHVAVGWGPGAEDQLNAAIDAALKR